MGVFSKVFKKGGGEEDINAPPGSAEMKEEKKKPQAAAAAPASESTSAEITKIKAQLESLGEMRKMMGERFTQTSEQIGELRGMINETSKGMQKMELSTTKAVGLVESIEPEKFFVMIQKQDVKIEALRAAIESKEAMIQQVMSELKQMRKNIQVFRGVEQVVKMTDDVKDELSTLRKVKGVVERHADKVETFFTEIQKNVRGFDEFKNGLKELQKNQNKIAKTADQTAVKQLLKSDKADLEALIKNFKEFEDHTFKVIRLLNKEFKDVRTDFKDRFETKFKRAEHINRILQDLIKPSPELKQSLKKIKELAEEEVKQEALIEARRKAKAKPGLLDKVFKRGKKEGEEEKGEGEEGKGEGEKESKGEEKKE